MAGKTLGLSLKNSFSARIKNNCILFCAVHYLRTLIFKRKIMNTNIENISSTRRKIEIGFDAKEVSDEKASTLADFVKNAKIQGFRPGKAPVAMVEKSYAKDIAEYTNRGLSQKAVAELNKIKDFDLFAIVDMKDEDADGGKKIIFMADIYPSFELPADLKATVELPEVKVTDEEVQNGVNYYLNQRAAYNEVDREVRKGDFVRIGYNGQVDGKDISEILPDMPMFGRQSSTWEEAGNEAAPGVQGIVQGIIGMNKGDKKTVSHEFPKEFATPELAGKKADYEVEVFEVREKSLPEIDEEFLKAFELKTKEELEERIRKDILADKTQHNEVMKRQKAIEAVMQGIQIDVPESAVEEEKNIILEDMMMRFMSSGASRADLENSKEALFESAARDAEIRARMKIFLNRVAKANEIKVDNEDMSRLVWQESMRMRIKPDDFIKSLKKDQGKINRMRSEALVQKTINFIAEKADVKAVEETK